MRAAVAAPLASLALRLTAALALVLALLVPDLAAPRLRTTLGVLYGREEAATAAQLAAQATADGLPARLLPPRPTLAAALAASLRPPRAVGALVIVGDHPGERAAVADALALARHAGVPVYWQASAAEPPDAELAALEAPDRVATGTPLEVLAHARTRRAARLVLADDAGREIAETLAPGTDRAVALRLEAPAPGAHAYTVSLRAEDGSVLALRALAVTVTGRGRVLYVGGASAPLATSLRAGGWPVDEVPPERVPSSEAALAGYAIVVLDDVPASAPPADFWPALATAVREHGAGLLTLGGAHAFGAGGYRGAPVESLLPLLSEAPRSDERAAVAFVVDKSGSMGRTSAGVDRLAVARAAVLESAATLEASDATGLVAFDAEPRMVVPLGPAAAARAAFASPWPFRAGGGTRIAPALAMADEALSRMERSRRYLVLITDGFVADEPLEDVAQRLAAHRVTLIVLAIGADANLAALSRVRASLEAEVLPVADVASLPRFARDALARRRSALLTGARAVVAREPFPGLEPARRWPPVEGLAVTRPAAGARVYLAAASGEPVLAAVEAGRGRSIALPAGLGAWARAWIDSSGWPSLAGALASAAEVRDDRAEMSLEADAAGDGIVVTIDLANGGRWADLPAVPLQVQDPAGHETTAEALPAGPGRYRARVPAPVDGAYRITVTAATASRTVIATRERPRDVTHRDPVLEEALAARRLERWSGASAVAVSAPSGPPEAGRARLAGLASLAWLVALLIDYRSAITAPLASLVRGLRRR